MGDIKDILLDSILAVTALLSAVYAGLAVKNQMSMRKEITLDRMCYSHHLATLHKLANQKAALEEDNAKLRALVARNLEKIKGAQADPAATGAKNV